jgi:PAS domain S-box-containing protein
MSSVDDKIKISVNGVDITWDLKSGTLEFFGISSTLFWNDPSLLNMFKPLVDEVGKELYCLQVAHSSSLGTKEDYHNMVTQLGTNFEEGFLNWGKAVSSAGWGVLEMPLYDPENYVAKVIVHNPWELNMQHSLPQEEKWGTPFLLGKLIGIFNHAFNDTCWAKEECFFEEENLRVEFDIYKNNETIEERLEELREEKKQAEIVALKRKIEEAVKEKNELLDKEQILSKNLSESKHQLELIFENAQVGLMHIDAQRKLLKCNKRLSDIFGYDSPKEMLGISMRELHLSEERYIEYGKLNFEPLINGIKRDIEYQLKKKDGTAVWCELAGKVVDDHIPADMSKGVLWVINDITLKKQYQIELANSEILRRNIITNIPDLLWIKDINGVYLACNKRFEDFFGAKEEEIIGKTDYDFVDKELADFFREHDKKAMNAQQASSNYEEITFANDGHKEYLHTTKTKVIDQDGKLYGVLGIGRDMTSLRDSQKEIDILNERYELTLDSVDDGIWDWDIKNDSLYLSKNWGGMLGYDVSEIEPNVNGFISLVHPDDVEFLSSKLHEHLANPTHNKYAVRVRLKCKDGSFKWILTRGKAYLDKNNQPYRMLGYHSDITLEKEYQLQLQEQKEEFETIFDSSKDGIAVIDLESNFLNCNSSYLEMSGYTKSELLTKSCIELSIPEDKEKAKRAIEKTIEVGYVKNLEKTCFKKDGETITVNMTASLLPDKKRILIVAKDISSLKLMEEQAKLASMGEMIGNIAHQWRQPLSIISIASTGVLFHQEMGTLKDELITKEMKSINENAQYLSKTIDDFKNFIRNDESMESTSIQEALEYALHLTEAPLKNNYVNVVKYFNDDMEIYANKNELIQSFINIINNAKDILKEKKDESDRYIFIKMKKLKKDKLEVLICDSGGGIPEEIKNRIFEPYFTTKHQSVGTGIGLSMTHKILNDKYKAGITAYNDKSKYENKDYFGACFQVIFDENKD